MDSFAYIKFWDVLFSIMMPNFCRAHAMSIHKMQQFPWTPLIVFGKIKLILYPRVRNSTTHLTLVTSAPTPHILYNILVNIKKDNMVEKSKQFSVQSVIRNFIKEKDTLFICYKFIILPISGTNCSKIVQKLFIKFIILPISGTRVHLSLVNCTFYANYFFLGKFW